MSTVEKLLPLQKRQHTLPLTIGESRAPTIAASSREALSISSKGRLKNYSFLDYFDDNVVDKHFVRTRRVGLDAVLAAIGSERLWQYIMYKLTALFPIRDYNRAIAMPANEILYPESVQKFLVLINSFVEEKILKDEHKKIEETLANIQGMIDVKQKNEQIENQLQGLVSNNEGMKLLVLKIEELCKELLKILDSKLSIII